MRRNLLRATRFAHGQYRRILNLCLVYALYLPRYEYGTALLSVRLITRKTNGKSGKSGSDGTSGTTTQMAAQSPGATENVPNPHQEIMNAIQWNLNQRTPEPDCKNASFCKPTKCELESWCCLLSSLLLCL